MSVRLLEGDCMAILPTLDSGSVDPCAGSGTTGEAADGIGRNAILIEQKREYCEIIRDRISNGTPLFGNPLEAA